MATLISKSFVHIKQSKKGVGSCVIAVRNMYICITVTVSVGVCHGDEYVISYLQIYLMKFSLL
jgi:hypothetical protein